MTDNLITIAAEVSMIVLFLFLVDFSIGKGYRRILQIPVLSKYQNHAKGIRRKLRAAITLLGILLTLSIVGVNAFLIYKGENVREYSIKLVRSVPKEVWMSIGQHSLETIGIVIVTLLVLNWKTKVLANLSQYTQDFDKIIHNDRSIGVFFLTLNQKVDHILWLLILTFCASRSLPIPDSALKMTYAAINLYALFAIGLLFYYAVPIIFDTLDGLSSKNPDPESYLRYYDQFYHFKPFAKLCLEYGVYTLTAMLMVQQLSFSKVLTTIFNKGIAIFAIVMISRILISVIQLVVEQFLLNLDGLDEQQQKRRRTITPLIQSAFKYFIYFGASIAFLETLGIDAGPILAGAGILSLAVGFGAQNLINDIVSGFFILFENYYLVGDYIQAGNADGYVEAIELRTTRIRHNDGQVYIVRNGDISGVTNYSKEFVYAVLCVGIDYETDVNLVYEIIEKIGIELAESEPAILAPTTIQGIDDFGVMRLVIHTKTKVKPGQHIPVQRLLRKRIKEEFDRHNIYIPISDADKRPNWALSIRSTTGSESLTLAKETTAGAITGATKEATYSRENHGSSYSNGTLSGTKIMLHKEQL